MVLYLVYWFHHGSVPGILVPSWFYTWYTGSIMVLYLVYWFHHGSVPGILVPSWFYTWYTGSIMVLYLVYWFHHGSVPGILVPSCRWFSPLYGRGSVFSSTVAEFPDRMLTTGVPDTCPGSSTGGAGSSRGRGLQVDYSPSELQ